MRLFVAINFNDEMKKELAGVTETLRANTLKGNFTLIDNLHLTVEFIGETQNAAGSIRALESVECEAFTLKTAGPGSFGGGRVCWLGVERNEGLTALYEQVHRALLNEGFRLEERPFKPHLTLAREVVFQHGFDWNALMVRPLVSPVTEVSLMKSERIGGRLVYKPIKKRALAVGRE